jgi:UDP-N-acetylglucosamine 3-dehydrogenase
MKIKVAIIGCGYWGTNIGATLEKMDSIETLIFDSNKNKLNLLAKRFPKLKKINSLKEILLDKDIKGVIIATNPTTHFNLAQKIIISGKAIFVEKPLTKSSGDIQKLIDLSKLHKTIVMSGYIYHYNSYINYIKNIIKNKKLGEIKFIEFIRNNLGPIRTDVSCIWDLASHDISTALLLLGSIPKITEVTKYNILSKKNFDTACINLKFKNTFVNINCSWLYPEKIRKLTIVGSKKMLLFDEMDRSFPVKIYEKYATYPDIKSLTKNKFNAKAKVYVGKTVVPKIKYSQPLKNEMLHFVSCIKKKITPITDANHALKIAKLIEKIEK